MKLISKFSDYYDSFASFGFDPKVVFARKNEKFSFLYRDFDQAMYDIAQKIKSSFSISYMLNRSVKFGGILDGDGFRIGYVGFCGHIYPFLYASEVKSVLDGSERGFVPTYTTSSGTEYVKRHFLFSEADVLKFLNFPEGHPKHKELRLLKLNEFFVQKEMLEPFLKLNCPVFAYVDRLFEINPKLVDYSFARVKDGVQAFQEISAFISGVLNTQDQMPPIAITDVDRAHSKGFDKMSFRREKTKAAKG